MGIDAVYQALPEGMLLERADRDSDFAESLGFFESLATRGARAGAGEPHQAIAAAGRLLLVERPTLLQRRIETRSWDGVFWLLSEGRRQGRERDPHGLAEHVVFGAETFASASAQSANRQIRFVRPEEASALARFIEAAIPAARTAYEQKWATAQIYKKGADAEFAELEALLVDYARLYRGAAKHGERVVVFFH